MKKKLILLTKSLKKQNYCTAGIDTETGEWIRIIGPDEDIQHAVTKVNMEYESGELPEVLDVISVQCENYVPNNYQSENYVLNDSKYWKKIGRASIEDVLQIHPPENKESIFYNVDKKVCDDEIDEILYQNRYSLMLIKPKFVTIHVKQWEKDSKKSIKASFSYNNHWYNYISITDPIILNYYNNEDVGNYKIDNNLLFVMSLADKYSVDNCHYKLIATILEI